MAMDLRLSQKQTQVMTMTPQLQQAIKLLQLGQMELVEEINQEMLENPMLELAPPPDSAEAAAHDKLSDPDYDQTPESEGREADEFADSAGATGEEVREEFDWENYLGEYSSAPSTSLNVGSHESPEETPGFESFVAAKTSLSDHLCWQWRFSAASERDLILGSAVIGSLTDDGYLAATLEELAEQAQATVEEMAAIVARVQELDPPGVAARDLAECLLIQLKRLEPDQQEPEEPEPEQPELVRLGLQLERLEPDASLDSLLAAEICRQYWDLVENKDVPGLCQKLKATKTKVMAAIKLIRASSLSSLAGEICHHHPDLVEKKDLDGLCTSLKAVKRTTKKMEAEVKEAIEVVIGFLESRSKADESRRQAGEIRRLAGEICRRHLDLLEKKDMAGLCRVLKAVKEDVVGAIEAVRSLEPRPGRPYNNTDSVYVTPDVYISKIGGEYVITLNEDGLPKLRISREYRRLLTDKTAQGETKKYLSEKLSGARFLIRSINQRQRTIYRVTEAIFKVQREFLDYGVEHLKPMVLRDIAEELGFHESTISRVTTNKYVYTPQGLFELKYFFDSPINRFQGEALGSESVKNRIRQIIAAEDPQKPLSDERVVEILRGSNIDIARRTVAKYREMLGLGSSSERRRMY